MKIPGLIIGSFAVAATASAAGVCDSPDCPACHAVSNSSLWGGLAVAGGLLVSRLGFKAFKTRRTNGIIAALALLFTFADSSFADDKKASGTNAPPEKVTIAQLQAKPDAYAGKQVTVKARVADICTSDGCLTLKDKFDVIEGVPPQSGFKKNPKVGSTLNVTGTVRVNGEGDKKEVAIIVKDFEEAKK